MAGFATLTDLKAHLNMSSSTHDGELTLMLDAAEDVVESFVGSSAAVPVIETVTVHGGTAILSRRPTGPVVVSPAIEGVTVNSAAGLLQGIPAYYGSLAVSYSAGDGVVPAAVTLATLVIAAHLWETQRGTSPTALQAADTNEFVPGLGFTIPNRAKELLEPFTIAKSQIA